MCVTVEVNNPVIMNNNRRLYKITSWNYTQLPFIIHNCQLTAITVTPLLFLKKSMNVGEDKKFYRPKGDKKKGKRTYSGKGYETLL
jgi:hypothetical protein